MPDRACPEGLLVRARLGLELGEHRLDAAVAHAVRGLVGGTLGLVLAILTWALVCALFYRTGMLKAAVVGLVAWVLYFLVTWLVGVLMD